MSEPTILDPTKVAVTYRDGENAILTIMEGPYEGLQFYIVYVAIDPVIGFHFDYKLVNGTVSAEDKPDLDQAVSRLVFNQVKQQYEAGELVYNGGTDVTPEEMLQYMEEKYGVVPEKQVEIELPDSATKNVAQMIMQQPGVFAANQNETAMSFLERLATEGMAAMRKK